MLGNRRLVLDTFCEVYDQLKHLADDEFFDFSRHHLVEGAIYFIGRAQANHNRERLFEIIEKDLAKIVYSNPAEGSETLHWQISRLGILDYVEQHRVLLIGGGDMQADIPCLWYDVFLPKIHDYTENLQEIARGTEIFTKTNKPYDFLFLNGRLRPHRKYLLESFRISGLLDRALWTNLDRYRGFNNSFQLMHQGRDIMADEFPIHYLPPQYEVPRYRANIGRQYTENFVKYDFFDHTWGEIYLWADPYIDTYFSLITETVFMYPHSFRTEKLWKPMAMGHPWIVAANRGFYRDLRSIGFRTFEHLIDESFDLIDDNRDRIDRIRDVVQDLCQQDLPAFLAAAKEVCDYNQQHLIEMRQQVRRELPDRVERFIRKYWKI
jgi:hypothetical protein